MKIGWCGVIGIVGAVCACGGNQAPVIGPNRSDIPRDPSFANNHAPPANPCDGIAVAAVTPADLKTFKVSDARCEYASTDLMGNLYVSAYRESVTNDFVVTSKGQTLNADLNILLRSGFAGFDDYDDSQRVRYYRTYSPEGAVLGSLEFPNGNVYPTRNPNGGSVLAHAQCDESAATSTIHLSYFDDDNTLTRTAKVSAQGCISQGQTVKVLVDSAGFTALVYGNHYSSATFGVARGRFAARWLDPSGAPVTDWFDAGPVDVGMLVQPVIGGGVAVSTDLSSWMFFPSGKAKAEQPPAAVALLTKSPLWLDRGELPIVLGGKAYATVSGTLGSMSMNGWIGTVNAPTGEVCAEFPLPPLDGSDRALFLGRDGTVINLDRQSCTASYYPGLLK